MTYRGAPPVEDECPECGGGKFHERWCSAYDGSGPQQLALNDQEKRDDDDAGG
jgi:hypothetical protein